MAASAVAFADRPSWWPRCWSDGGGLSAPSHRSIPTVGCPVSSADDGAAEPTLCVLDTPADTGSLGPGSASRRSSAERVGVINTVAVAVGSNRVGSWSVRRRCYCVSKMAV